jgi:hypothetical protein
MRKALYYIIQDHASVQAFEFFFVATTASKQTPVISHQLLSKDNSNMIRTNMEPSGKLVIG